jgi:rSAM/selenodomain-associated transferase 2
MTLTTPETSHISIIIPTLNEENNLDNLLSSLQAYQNVEIIVADGGSTDKTVDITRNHTVQVVTSPAGRGIQQNEGAKIASGNILVFLHCDTMLPDDFPNMIYTILNQPETAAGAFRLKINAKGRGYRLIEWGVNVRTRLLSLPYGDQVLFMKKNIFDQAGGFPNLPLLEDIMLIRRLKSLGKIRIAKASVNTSARRWQRLGMVKTTLINQIILAGYIIGIKPETLARLYYKTSLQKSRNSA